MSRFYLSEQGKVVTGLAPITPSTSTPDYISLKDISHVSVVIMADNATTVTGSDITLKQATAVAGTGEKALAFDFVYLNNDTAAGDALTKTAVVSDTFTLDATDNKNIIAVIEVDADDLDVDGGFDCIRAGTGDATAQVVSVAYVCSGLRYPQEPTATAITD